MDYWEILKIKMCNPFTKCSWQLRNTTWWWKHPQWVILIFFLDFGIKNRIQVILPGSTVLIILLDKERGYSHYNMCQS